MRNVYVIGVGMTVFGRHPERNVKSLVAEAVGNTLKDAGLEKGGNPGSLVWEFGMGRFF